MTLLQIIQPDNPLLRPEDEELGADGMNDGR